MNKITLGVLVGMVAALIAALPSVAAHASEDPYPDAVCDLSISPQSVQGGDDFTVTVTSDRPADLSVTFRGETRSESGVRKLVTTFRAPTVSEAQSMLVSASCDDVTRSASVQILPAGASGAGEGVGGTGGSALAGILPRTGGVALWLLLLGAALAVAGGTVLVRRRS
ncbi:LPXTG cell wall anchor domain-containing protein [Aeromicrobium sp. CTD01-1L150]|uniref:LPXTG cell wall anchor domain-containing protein n=1 Tax=Aeromicrobium sp. CTD01-1L150 TaxID=3341830 RepID=UPI0035BEBEF0